MKARVTWAGQGSDDEVLVAKAQVTRVVLRIEAEPGDSPARYHEVFADGRPLAKHRDKDGSLYCTLDVTANRTLPQRMNFRVRALAEDGETVSTASVVVVSRAGSLLSQSLAVLTLVALTLFAWCAQPHVTTTMKSVLTVGSTIAVPSMAWLAFTFSLPIKALARDVRFSGTAFVLAVAALQVAGCQARYFVNEAPEAVDLIQDKVVSTLAPGASALMSIGTKVAHTSSSMTVDLEAAASDSTMPAKHLTDILLDLIPTLRRDTVRCRPAQGLNRELLKAWQQLNSCSQSADIELTDGSYQSYRVKVRPFAAASQEQGFARLAISGARQPEAATLSLHMRGIGYISEIVAPITAAYDQSFKENPILTPVVPGSGGLSIVVRSGELEVGKLTCPSAHSNDRPPQLRAFVIPSSGHVRSLRIDDCAHVSLWVAEEPEQTFPLFACRNEGSSCKAGLTLDVTLGPGFTPSLDWSLGLGDLHPAKVRVLNADQELVGTAECGAHATKLRLMELDESRDVKGARGPTASSWRREDATREIERKQIFWCDDGQGPPGRVTLEPFSEVRDVELDSNGSGLLRVTLAKCWLNSVTSQRLEKPPSSPCSALRAKLCTDPKSSGCSAKVRTWLDNRGHRACSLESLRCSPDRSSL